MQASSKQCIINTFEGLHTVPITLRLKEGQCLNQESQSLPYLPGHPTSSMTKITVITLSTWPSHLVNDTNHSHQLIYLAIPPHQWHKSQSPNLLGHATSMTNHSHHLMYLAIPPHQWHKPESSSYLLGHATSMTQITVITLCTWPSHLISDTNHSHHLIYLAKPHQWHKSQSSPYLLGHATSMTQITVITLCTWPSHLISDTNHRPPQWEAADAEIKVPSSENAELKHFPFRAWSRSVYSHTCYAYCQGFLPCLFLPFQSMHLHFFQSLSQFFLRRLWFTHGSCVGPKNKIGHPARGRFPCWVPVEYR